MVKDYQSQLGIWVGATVVLMVTQPVYAASTQVTGVEIKPNGNSIELRLSTNGGEGLPQVLTENRGNELVANIMNTQLKLPSGQSFVQENPIPGISSVEVTQGDSNSVRVVVRGESSPPRQQILQQEARAITLSLGLAEDNQATSPTLSAESSQSQESPVAQTPTAVEPAKPEILFPDPEITIDGTPAPATGVVQPVSPAPPFLPRAVAPPVGDIAVANIDSSPEILDLGTAARVPRLVLREAPVREVLGLLARSAGLNLIFTNTEGEGVDSTISLDLENVPVQDVFNYVLQVSGVEASRRDNTIFAGSQLPLSTRRLVTRTFRLNQVEAANAAAFLAGQGAAVQRLVTPITETRSPTTGAVVERREEPAELQPLTVNQPEGGGPLLLQGLSVATDDRLNALTMVGEPRKVQIATSFLTQLDARRRQVAINVKIVDVNLAGTEAFNASFSFGVGDGFFVQDNGAAIFNYGGFNPPDQLTVTGSSLSPPVITNPFAGATIFLDPNSTIAVPGTGTGERRIVDGELVFDSPPGAGIFLTPRAEIGDDPFDVGITDVTLGTRNVTQVDITPAVPPTQPQIITNPVTGEITFVPGTAGIPQSRDTTFTAGDVGEITTSLPSLIQYPTRFLSLLQAQITSGNAKILTDPTLVVQEGQQATVNLTQEVVGNIESETESAEGIVTRTVTAEIKEAGLSLTVNVQRIDDNGFVTLSVEPTVTAIGNVQNLAVGDDINQIALLQRRELNSGFIRLRDAQTLILSGIIQESDRTVVSKVPILGDLPIIGALFRSTSRDNQRQEVIVLLTPQIIDDSERSAFGYNYTPGREAQEFLERRRFDVPRGRE
ncbi:type IV pilus secretin family protein [Oscillatoria salina]|uniref:type IV pilus secretin family protein n=1 Tax=Oscillatoria salina TaxID=331517 RepID=UPI001CCECA67|nr:type IV pilus secretin family protein [Oscillatoria salina]MBZ8181167.1 AMIN domain-containing protein [Oscillatoria salina IIICB1]